MGLSIISYFFFLVSHSPMAHGIKVVNRALRRKTEPKHAANLRRELLLFLAVYFKNGGSLGVEEHQLVNVSVRALFKALLSKALNDSEVGVVDDFQWLYRYVQDGISSIRDQQEALLAMTDLTALLSKMFKKHWRHFGDVSSFFDTLRFAIKRFSNPALHATIRGYFLVDGVHLMLAKSAKASLSPDQRLKVQESFVQFLVSVRPFSALGQCFGTERIHSPCLWFCPNSSWRTQKRT